MDSPASIRLLRRREVEQLLGLSRSCIYDKMLSSSPRYDPTFPVPIRIGSHAVAWIYGELERWLSSRVRTVNHSQTGS